MTKRYKDGIDDLMDPNKPLNIRESENYSEKVGLSYIGKPKEKVPPPALSGEEPVRHRSPSKGNRGLDYDTKIELMDTSHILKASLGPEESMRIAFMVDEWATTEEKRLEELRKRYGNRLYLGRDNVERARHLAKKLRSV